MKTKSLLNLVIGVVMNLMLNTQSLAATKTALTGNWNAAAAWSPSGVPVAADSAIIPNGVTMTMNNNQSIKGVNILTGGTLNFTAAKTLTITSSITVAGTMNMTGGITLSAGKAFNISAGGTVVWNPNSNTLAAATLFTNGVENFASTSNLTMMKWYDYNVALGSVVTGNFGNLTMNSISGGSLYEWKQANQFATHQVLGTLTVDQGVVTLDNTGVMSTTTFGNINLTSVNSWLYFHNGSHPGSFTINTTNLTIYDGTIYGAYNGNGNVTFNVSGNISLTGWAWLFLINNAGTAGVGNGNSTLNCTGNFTLANTAEYYGIYNATTTTAGVNSTTIGGNLNYNAERFVLQYACHNGTGTSSLTVNGTSTINYPTTTSQFNLVGLSNISIQNNLSKLNWKNIGDVTISGNTSAVFCTSAGMGVETDSLMGNVTIGGGQGGLNWPGAAAQAHATTLYVGGSLSMSAGDIALSYFGNTLNTNIAGNLTISGGTMRMRRQSGNSTINLTGNYSQTGGSCVLIGNTTPATTGAPTFNVQGNYSISGGTFDMSQYPGLTASDGTSIINLYNNFTYSGGTITETSLTVGRGQINFTKTGTQNVTGGGTISNTIDFNVMSGSTTNLGSAVLTGLGNFVLPNSGNVMVGSTGGISSIGLTGNVQVVGTRNYGTGSTYTYNGSAAQITGSGLPSTVANLIINNSAGVTLSQNVSISNTLTLTSGKLNTGLLYEVRTTNNSPSSISGHSTSSYIVGNLRRDVTGTGAYAFPVGTSAYYEPITITLNGTSGFTNILGNFINSYPIEVNLPLLGINVNGTAITEVLDYGYWSLDPNGTLSSGSYDIELTERGFSGTASNPQSYCVLKRHDILSSWESIGIHNNATQSIVSNAVTAVRSGLTTFSHYSAGRGGGSLPIELLYFKAEKQSDVVDLSWATANEINNDFFTVERSTDGQNFAPVLTQPGAGTTTSTKYYSATDQQPPSGYLYYRLKQTDFDGHFTYSDVETIKDRNAAGPQFEIMSIGPNPFTESFKINWTMKESGNVTIMITNAGGQLVKEEDMIANDGYNTYEFIDDRNLTKGTYIITIIAGDEKQTKKIIKN